MFGGVYDQRKKKEKKYESVKPASLQNTSATLLS